MIEIEKRIAALEVAIKHVFQALPAEHLAEARESIDAAIEVWQASPVPQQTTYRTQNSMQRSAEFNPNATREAAVRQAEGDALQRARALIDLVSPQG